MRLVALQLRRLFRRIGRDRPFTRREQLSLVMASHVGILIGALVIGAIFSLSSGLPTEFVLCELAIIVLAAPFSIKFPGLEEVFVFAMGPPLEAHYPGGEEFQEEAEKKEAVENVAGGVLILASVLQFAALAWLLWGTGGPIDSPFAEMTLIIAVFTPFIANNPKTIGVVVVASITYYAVFIWLFTQTHSPPPAIPRVDATVDMPGPSVWAYFCVNVMILVGGIVFTTLESLLHNAELARATRKSVSSGGAENGDGDGIPEPPKAAENSDEAQKSATDQDEDGQPAQS